MHDTLQYLSREPIHRSYHHSEITFSILYAWSENFMLPLSHDEVVHGKAHLVNKFPGDRWQKLATLRALYGFMWAHPGKKLLFMGSEFAQNEEWNESVGLQWFLTEFDEHKGVMNFVSQLNRRYKAHAGLWEKDVAPEGFSWLVGDDGGANVLAFARFDSSGGSIVSITNFSPVPHENYEMPFPATGIWREIINSDAIEFGGSGVANESVSVGEDFRARLRVPPLATIWLIRS